MSSTEHPDWPLIVQLGGPAKVADLLDYPKQGGAQRVQNWKHRGIPPSVKLERPDLFLPHLAKAAPAPPPHPLRRSTDKQGA